MIVRLKLEALTISFQVFLGDGHTSDRELLPVGTADRSESLSERFTLNPMKFILWPNVGNYRWIWVERRISSIQFTYCRNYMQIILYGTYIREIEYI